MTLLRVAYDPATVERVWLLLGTWNSDSMILYLSFNICISSLSPYVIKHGSFELGWLALAALRRARSS